ncbi:class I adenylate-forming enzyme family protein [Minwuia thermotolerans]|uniref:AMP-dependent synthetase n=1 Tax=Minwuia thermotolerans TaxID=2056226 RepID=A0A2M9G5U0_9PROT|nr:AMP-binding protein [Minwuia thermotolerans]PJK31089.1 AMP-dependent synthetase [Minwuia thermotolerans]
MTLHRGMIGTIDGIGPTIERLAAASPGSVALVDHRGALNRVRLAERIVAVAGWLSSKVPPGASVALHLPDTPDFIVAFVAAVWAGCNVQVLNRDWPRATVAEIRSRLRPDLLLDDPACLKAAAESGPTVAPAPPVSIDQPFYTGFTSGSTGLPKGFVRTQRSWIASFRSDNEEFAYSARDVFAVPGSFTHSMPLYGAIRGLYAGARVLCLGTGRPDRMVALMSAEEATVLYAVPTQLQTIVEAARRKKVRMPAVRLVLTGGAKAAPALQRAIAEVFPEAEFCEFYGSSELSYVSLARARENAPATSVGRPFPGVRIHVLGDDESPLPRGRVGRIFVESPFRFLGYALGSSKGELSFATAVPGAICVGDTGWLDENGFLHLAGRTSRMIVSSGRNIHPEAIEEVLERHPGVRSAAGFGIDDAKRGQRLVAVVRLEAGCVPACAELIRHCAVHLPDYNVPRIFHRIEDWPATASGKTDFPAIRGELAAGRLPRLS